MNRNMTILRYIHTFKSKYMISPSPGEEDLIKLLEYIDGQHCHLLHHCCTYRNAPSDPREHPGASVMPPITLDTKACPIVSAGLLEKRGSLLFWCSNGSGISFDTIYPLASLNSSCKVGVSFHSHWSCFKKN